MWAIMPPQPLTEKIENIRNEFAEKYKAVAALKPPVHITLLPPYKAVSSTEEPLIAFFEEWATTQKAFSIALNAYDFFPRNGVVFIDVVENNRLEDFRKELRRQFLKLLPAAEVERSSSFHPHITIGYRDIPRGVFPLVQQEYSGRSFAADFVAGAFYFWRHTGQRWITIQSFPLTLPNISPE
jgi:2'-5' RNA ligase